MEFSFKPNKHGEDAEREASEEGAHPELKTNPDSEMNEALR